MPQPIDPSSELGRMSAAERVQRVMEQAATAVQQRSAEIAGADAQRQQQQVLQADPKQQAVEDAMKRRTPYVALRRKRKAQEDEAAEIYNAKQKHEHTEDGEHQLDVTL